MTEEFLHYVWKFRNFNNSGLAAHTGDRVEILKPGEHNRHSGPDFLNAVVRIGETLWAGNVEIHINSSDWKKHNHSMDKAYNNVILHVVYQDDCVISRSSGEAIPTVELKNRINQSLFSEYESLLSSNQWISCDRSIGKVEPVIISNWLTRLLVERLERKSEIITTALALNKYNWQQTFYQQLARNFGFKLNSGPFELLSKALPLTYLKKHRDNLVQLEALVFGQAGMLNGEFEEKYPQFLKKEYSYLRHKYNLKPIDAHLWKFLRLRPVSFPTIRLSQFAHLVHKSESLFSKILECYSLQDYYQLFNIKASAYWENHFTFGKPAVFTEKPFGKASVDGILINTVATFLFVYGTEKKEEKYKEKALHLLECIEGENNSIIKKWQETGVETQTAFQTQALLELKENYCNSKKCLSCNIGNHLLNRKN